MMNVLKGLLIAVSMLVPGVSGATMMMSFNVYKPSLEFITALTRGKLVHKKMMLHLCVGALFGFIGFSQLMLWALEEYGLWLRYFFFGSIVYGLAVITRQINFKSIKGRHFLLLFLGILSALGLEQLESITWVQSSPDIILVLIGGIGISVALILPGISTSFVLLVLGIYEPLLQAIRNGNWSFLLILVVGIILGVFLTAKSLVWLIHHHFNATMLLIVGFVLGSLWEVAPAFPSNLLSVLIIVLGAGFMMLIERLTKE